MRSKDCLRAWTASLVRLDVLRVSPGTRNGTGENVVRHHGGIDHDLSRQPEKWHRHVVFEHHVADLTPEIVLPGLVGCVANEVYQAIKLGIFRATATRSESPVKAIHRREQA